MKTTNRVQETLDTILTAFESGNVAEAIAHTVINATQTHIPMTQWSFTNQLVCYLSGTADARGYRQWGEINRHVKKGSKAIYILVPLMRKRKDADLEDQNARYVYGFKAAPVFKVENTEGEPVPEPEDLTPPQTPPLWEVAQAWNIPVSYIPFGEQFYGRYAFGFHSEQILLCTHDESTFFHELAHAAHNRLEPLQGGQQWQQEVVAELTAAVLGRLFNRDTEGRSYRYIAQYAEDYSKNPHKACLAVLSEVKQVLDLNLETAEAIGQRATVAA